MTKRIPKIKLVQVQLLSDQSQKKCHIIFYLVFSPALQQQFALLFLSYQKF